MTPQDGQRLLQPTANEIVFPAAYLQPPNFNPTADPAINYGAIGATIGHEIGHGFDDKGSRYDGTGTLNNWWTDEDRATFEKLGKSSSRNMARCARRRRQDLHQRPADAGREYRRPRRHFDGLSRLQIVARSGKQAPVINGLTGDQRFFISYAQHKRTKSTATRCAAPAAANRSALARFRPGQRGVRNFTPWYDAFNVKPGDKLYLPPEDRVLIW